MGGGEWIVNQIFMRFYCYCANSFRTAIATLRPNVPVGIPMVTEVLPSGLTADQKKYIDECEWQLNLMLRTVIEEAEKGTESREVLLASWPKPALSFLCATPPRASVLPRPVSMA